MEHKKTIMVCVSVCRGCRTTLHSNLLPLSPPPLLPPFSTGVLEIVEADEGDSGVYICTANGVSANFRVTIEDIPDGTYISHPMH